MNADTIETPLADGGCDPDATVKGLATIGIKAVFPSKENLKEPNPNGADKHEHRNLVERSFNKLKNRQRSAAQYYKSKVSYLDFIAIAVVTLFLFLCPRDLVTSRI